MELTSRLRLMNWLVRQGLTGLPGNDLIRGFCERCRAEGIELSRALVFIDTLHPVFEGRGFRWTDTETNESDSFEYGSTETGDAAENWRRTTFYHQLENGLEELVIDLEVLQVDEREAVLLRDALRARRFTGDVGVLQKGAGIACHKN